MTDWIIIALLLLAVAGVVALIWWTQRMIASMRSEVKETVEQALVDAREGFENASTKALYDQRGKASEDLGKSLSPVREELEKARKQLEDYSRQARDSETKSDSAHKEMIRSINDLDKEAKVLSRALRGEDVKMMGDWGENTLESILKISGLEEGISYDTQETVETGDGKKRPDVLIRLPGGGKVIAVDSKVSLAGYTEYVEAGDDKDGREAAVKKLADAVKKQAEETAKYKKIEGYETPDFALMFMPVEPAWELVQRHQNGKFIADIQRGKGVMILGPTNLMVSLQMVSHMWRGYKQEKNVKGIADIGGRMVDAIDLVLDRMAKVKKSVDASKECVDSLDKALTGQQGIENYARKLRELGVKGRKEGDSS